MMEELKSKSPLWAMGALSGGLSGRWHGMHVSELSRLEARELGCSYTTCGQPLVEGCSRRAGEGYQ